MDPRPTAVARHATVHLAPRPGTDAALMNGLLHDVIAHDRVDHDHLDAHAVGCAELQERVQEYTPEAVSTICDIPAEHVREAARILGGTGRLLRVVQDIVLSGTARLADVVLPAATWGEKTGTFTDWDATSEQPILTTAAARIEKTAPAEGPSRAPTTTAAAPVSDVGCRTAGSPRRQQPTRTSTRSPRRRRDEDRSGPARAAPLRERPGAKAAARLRAPQSRPRDPPPRQLSVQRRPQRAGAGAVLGTALTIKMIAYVGIAPVVNALVAGLPPRPVLIGADVVRAAMALCLPFIDQVWQVYAVVFVLQAASATFTPAFQSVIPAVLPAERDYTNALSLSRLAYDLESLVSPMAAAVLLSVLSYHDLFRGTAGGFVVSALVVATTALPVSRTVTGAQGSVWHRTTLGARIFVATPRLRSLLALDLAVAAPTALVLVNTVVYLRDVLGRSATDLAIALAAYGIGPMLVALAAPGVLERCGTRTVMLTGAAVLAVTMVATTVFSFRPGTGWGVLLGLWLVLGAGTSMILTPSARVLRDATDEHTRPYVFTAQFSLSHACFVLTYPLAGWVGAQGGLGAAATALTVITALGTGAARLSWPRPGSLASATVAPATVATATGAAGEDGSRAHRC
ncbi:MFS transporter [Kocuria sp. CPCC 205268]|uniref:MFS transporter n=1 Tax=Kocuria oxytropis TaxID=3058913 RepID=UPI0034D79D03